MTELRQRVLDAMTVRGLAQRTKECYTDAIARMARHCKRSPDLLSAQEVEAYLLHLVKDRKLSYSSVNHATISKLLGHGNISTTGRYLHLISPQFRPPKGIDPLDLLARLPKL